MNGPCPVTAASTTTVWSWPGATPPPPAPSVTGSDSVALFEMASMPPAVRSSALMPRPAVSGTASVPGPATVSGTPPLTPPLRATAAPAAAWISALLVSTSGAVSVCVPRSDAITAGALPLLASVSAVP
ncbi:MAG: hypothetical protein BWX70_02717 [Verrucomicrobia bacterium ADurb.Bin070]|nr:MAG: hypothetical protein BWX70_02717 [Verrucomicrobia bacterium ADurb.Bin070]